LVDAENCQVSLDSSEHHIPNDLLFKQQSLLTSVELWNKSFSFVFFEK
jgi:hypothetical protein